MSTVYYPRTQQASLGCGTLILIALIVLFFSGRGDIESEVRKLRADIKEVKQLVEAQNNQIRLLRDRLEKAHLPAEKAFPGE
jgi:Sec-independent protein translocase protein TatA